MSPLTFLLAVVCSCMLNSAVDACGMGMTRSGMKTVKLGSMSAASDDAESVATCPSGSVVGECYCSDGPNCDGVVVDGLKCKAYNKAFHSGGIQAVAVCVEAPSSDYKVVVSTAPYEDNPSAKCPCDFRVDSCYIHNKWTQSGCREPVITNGGTVCKNKSTCNNGGGCRAIAICKKVR